MVGLNGCVAVIVFVNAGVMVGLSRPIVVSATVGVSVNSMTTSVGASGVSVGVLVTETILCDTIVGIASAIWAVLVGETSGIDWLPNEELTA